MSTLKAPVALVILDGWGLGKQDDPSNAIVAAKTPNMTALLQEYPTTALECSGEAVGLPDGQMGNSEVGHLNMGAGRVVYQELTRITKAIREGEFYNNDVLKSVVENVKKNNSALHLMGLVSNGGVHSHINHLVALIELAKRNSVEKVYIHAFLDGRDVPPSSAEKFVAQLEEKIAEIGAGQIATVAGR